ncbi:MAG: hypothetical protein ACJA08_002039 [Cyclobacteriaceae bacterium]|jgi:hypothetical protein
MFDLNYSEEHPSSISFKSEGMIKMDECVFKKCCEKFKKKKKKRCKKCPD